jgi:hypothetical protein
MSRKSKEIVLARHPHAFSYKGISTGWQIWEPDTILGLLCVQIGTGRTEEDAWDDAYTWNRKQDCK